MRVTQCSRHPPPLPVRRSTFTVAKKQFCSPEYTRAGGDADDTVFTATLPLPNTFDRSNPPPFPAHYPPAPVLCYHTCKGRGGGEQIWATSASENPVRGVAAVGNGGFRSTFGADFEVKTCKMAMVVRTRFISGARDPFIPHSHPPCHSDVFTSLVRATIYTPPFTLLSSDDFMVFIVSLIILHYVIASIHPVGSRKLM